MTGPSGVRGAKPTAAPRSADVPAGRAPSAADKHLAFLEQQISELKGLGRGFSPKAKQARAMAEDLGRDVRLLTDAMAGKTVLPPATRAQVEAWVAPLPAGEKAIVRAKAAELCADGASLEQKGAPRFAANLAGELSEYFATGATPSPALQSLVEQVLFKEGAPVFLAEPSRVSDYRKNVEIGSAMRGLSR